MFSCFFSQELHRLTGPILWLDQRKHLLFPPRGYQVSSAHVSFYELTPVLPDTDLLGLSKEKKLIQLCVIYLEIKHFFVYTTIKKFK